jgi:DNA-binding NarL/FixJ family response regulator
MYMSELLGANAPNQFEVVLHPADPLVRMLVDFRKRTDREDVMITAQQRRLVAAAQQGEEGADSALYNNYCGIIATVACSFISPDVDSHDLIVSGREALDKAVRSFDPEQDEEFSDQAVIAVHEAMKADHPEVRPLPAGNANDRPTERVHQFITGLKVTSAVELEPRNIKQHRRELARLELLTPAERRLLPLMHLTDRQVSEQGDVEFTSVPNLMASIRKKLRVETRTAAALKALRLGVEFDIKSPPAEARFTRREREIADRLDRRNPQICEELELGRNSVTDAVSSLLRKTGAQTRTELALMKQLYHFRPAKGEAEVIPEALADFTPQQRRVLQLLHLPYGEIAERLELDTNKVQETIHYAKRRMDRPMSTTELALELQRRGLEFDIKKPERPLVELLTNIEVEIAGLLGQSNEQITQTLGVKRINDRIWEMKRKLGARTRTEMALMVARFDTGERRPAELKPREQLAARLGWKTLDGCNIELILNDHTTSRQQEVLTAKYLRDEPISWSQVSKQLGIERPLLIQTASRAIARLGRLGIKPPVPEEPPTIQTFDEEEYFLEHQAA